MDEIKELNAKGEDKNVAYKIAMLGESAVGKSSLTYQFTTSEYICAYDLSLGELKNDLKLLMWKLFISHISHILRVYIDDDYGQKTVSVLLNNQETDLEVIDHPACEMSVSEFSFNFFIFSIFLLLLLFPSICISKVINVISISMGVKKKNKGKKNTQAKK